MEIQGVRECVRCEWGGMCACSSVCMFINTHNDCKSYWYYTSVCVRRACVMYLILCDEKH